MNTISYWNNLFSNMVPMENINSLNIDKSYQELINWVTDNSQSILDYGCGRGTMLLKCACNKNIIKCLGIDISQKAVDISMKTAEINNLSSKVKFYCGEINELEKINDNSFDAVILSNVLDNVLPNDALKILRNINRILVPNGKSLILFNPYLNQNKLIEYGMKLIDDGLYKGKEGLLLVNLTTDEWEKVFNNYFHIAEYKQISFGEQEQFNRAFLLTKKV